ncbi:methyltransferase, FxLD system [Streptomyces cathayae]|uniref:Protein-L-isoaspartate O-methyltransferase n=1 Tax=Streptomyces cathayae TaxID=3031124 RepID=A0ABY8JV37_9ACTN|nr:methyltransferase, FxLD system [Streptomyces sp. HUAS 5]WGD39725.1 methyltransferase, FxLD system [Streptomyces sp. HUAS 5]
MTTPPTTELDEASEPRHRLADQLHAAGHIRTTAVENAFHTVPRHAFAPDVPIHKAYANDIIPTHHTADGRIISSVSAPWLQADMLEAARIRPGHRVLEIGSGGYNAALIAELVGPTGSVTTLDIDPAVTDHAARFLAETGYDRVRVVTADAEHLHAGIVPDGGFDTILVTVATWDLPWIDAVADGGRLVAPLRLHQYTWAIGFTRRDGALHSDEPLIVCGFVAMQGDGAWNTDRRTVPGTGVHLSWEDGTPLPVDQLEPALTREPVVAHTHVTVGGQEPFDALTLYLAGALPGFCRLSVDPDGNNGILNPPPRHWPGAAIVRGPSLARLATERISDGDDGNGLYELVVHGYGPHGHLAAQEMTEQVQHWQRNHRAALCPRITVHPLADGGPATVTDDPHVFVKKRTRVVIDWPIVPGTAALLTDAERSLLAAHVPPAAGGRALDVGCGTGELAAHLSSAGYTVDAVDRSETALAEASSRHGGAARWLRLDIEEDDGAALHGDGYDLITLRFVAPFLSSRAHTLDALGRRLRPGGTLVIITPLAVDTPAARRGIALAEDELERLQSRWAAAERHDADGLVFLVLRGPRQDETAPHLAAQHTPSSAHNGEGDAPRRRHHFHLLGRYYAQVESGRKTIEVRVATPEKAAVEVGDAIVFHDRDSDRELDIVVKRITTYGSFEDLLSAEDPTRIDPDGRREELLASLRSIYPPAKEALGALALEFDHRPARPGRPMPMTPSQYAQTVPHHTVYGCLYVRDEHDRPVQLRSVYGSRLWQFPGGNLDVQREDPLQTARREAVEETGLELGPETPRLLLTHFLHAGPRMPLNKVGLIFDGGRLSADRLGRIRLDPAEHDMWAAHDLADWQELMAPLAFARLDAVERARRGEGPAYLITHT